MISKLKNIVFCLILMQFVFLQSCKECNNNLDIKNNSQKKENTITIDSTNKTKIKKDTMPKRQIPAPPDFIDEFSETIIYYESYIGEAYSKKEYKKHFEVNRKYLDSLIDEFDKKN